MATQPITDPMEGMPDSESMDDGELASLLSQYENRAVGYFTSEIADEQATAIDYYYGRPFGDERNGRSKVVDRTVAITVDNALAALLKPFVSAEDVVSFEPRGPEDEKVAEQATEYVNYCFQCDNPGFTILHNWFKDALLTKIGVVKYSWEDKSRNERRDVPADAQMVLMAREQPGYLGETENPDGTFTLHVEEMVADGAIKVENVPPEEFLISPFARSIEDAPYVAHRPANVTRSALLEMGFDAEVVEGLSAFAAGKNEESRVQSRYQDEEWIAGGRDNPGGDPSGDIIGVIDEYVRVDYNGDGLSELRHVVRVMDTILFNEEVEEVPFALLCPIPMPHKVYGMSLADQTLDLQRIASVVWRQTLDNLYLSNNPRPVVPDAAVNDSTWEDLEDDAPGAAISVKAPGMLDWSVVPFSADKSFPMLAFIGEQVEARTGVRRGGNGLSRNSLDKNNQMTALQAAQIEAKENERVEMIARIFAETGLTRLFKGLLGLITKYQPKARVIRLRNEWVEIDPRGWPEMDVRISVGLGIGNRMEQIGQADAVLSTMADLQQTPFGYMLKPENVYNAIKRKFQAAGIKNVDDFISDPSQSEPPPQQPDPEMMKVQGEQQKAAAQLQLEEQKASAEMQLSQAKNEAALQAQREKAMLEAELARDKAQAELQLAQQKMAMEMNLAREKMMMEAEIARENAALNATVRMSTETDAFDTNRPGGDLDK
jgi:hypothetical protein